MLLKILLLYLSLITHIMPTLPTKFFGGPDHHVPYHLRKINYNLVCRLQPNGFPCDESYTSAKFYYDTAMETCMTFFYKDCKSSHNQFDQLTECNSLCHESMLDDKILQNLTTDMICRLQPDSGTCNKYFPMYYFDISTRICKGFSYSGCGGNFNRFETELQCKTVCNEAIPNPDFDIQLKK